MTILFSLIGINFLACGEKSTPTLENPSGDCEADSNGSRTCYHAPIENDTYLPDFDTDLSRQYST